MIIKEEEGLIILVLIVLWNVWIIDVLKILNVWNKKDFCDICFISFLILFVLEIFCKNFLYKRKFVVEIVKLWYVIFGKYGINKLDVIVCFNWYYEYNKN